MKLIVDSGSSTSDWTFIKDSKVVNQLTLAGINPIILDRSKISQIIASIEPIYREQTDEIHFYGAGCRDQETKEKIHIALKETFTNSSIISVQSDIMAVIDALDIDSEAIVGILGTGINIVHISGKQIKNKMTSLGYLLGDEGSGFHIGKKIIQYYYSNDADNKSKTLIEHTLGSSDPISAIYSDNRPNQKVAALANIVSKLNLDVKDAILKEVFNEFSIKFASFYSQLNTDCSIYLMGSIAYHFEKELNESLSNFGLSVSKTYKSPMSGLINFHS